MKKTMLHLPYELIIEILLRLPVKSLISFKCVCKSWFSIISDSYFANLHFELTSATHTQRVLFISSTSPHQFRSIDLELSHDDQWRLQEPGAGGSDYIPLRKFLLQNIFYILVSNCFSK
ncbi:F-box/kelch-repeat protein [Trifolium repens]|nr:F-box/kelch-repeat protein [Trifolium repens]